MGASALHSPEVAAGYSLRNPVEARSARPEIGIVVEPLFLYGGDLSSRLKVPFDSSTSP